MKKRYMVTLDVDVMERYQAIVAKLARGMGLGTGAGSAILNDILKSEIIPTLERTLALEEAGMLNRVSLLDMLTETTDRLESLKTEIMEEN